MPASKKNIVLINSQDIQKVVVTAIFEIDITDNLDQAMLTVREILDGINAKADMDQDAIDIAIEASIKESRSIK